MVEMNLQADARLPAYLRLRDELAARIAAGEWRTDEALPSDNRLARDGDLSVGTVRKAVQMLVDEGLLERRQGSGTYLRKPASTPRCSAFSRCAIPAAGSRYPAADCCRASS